MVEPGKNILKIKALRWLENAILVLVFSSTVNSSYTLFQKSLVSNSGAFSSL